MGTRCNTIVVDESGEILVNLYRQYDGYPDGHGAELAEFLAGKEIINGIGDPTAKAFNGLADLAARVVGYFVASKGSEETPGYDELGGFYLFPTDGQLDNDYTYRITAKTGDKEATIECLSYGSKFCKAKASRFDVVARKAQELADQDD